MERAFAQTVTAHLHSTERGLHETSGRVSGCGGEARGTLIFIANLRRVGLPAAVAFLIALFVLPIAPISADDSGRSAITGIVRAEGPGGMRLAPNVEVQLIFGGGSQTRRTDEEGRYRFADLLGGKYTVKVMAPAGFRVAGDATVGLSVDGKRDQAIDFKLLATTPAAPAAGLPASNGGAQGPVAPGSSASGASAQGAAQQGLLPASILPRGSIAQPSPVPQANASPGPRTATGRNESALALTAPSVVVVPTSTPGAVRAVASPRAAPPLPSLEDAQANLPPRRLITSFAALSDSAREGTVGQLRTYTNDSSLVLGVPFRTQIDGTAYSLVNCGPASLSMVLAAYGIDVDPPSLRDYLNSMIGNFSTEIGTSLEHLGRIAREAGLSTLGLYGRGGYRAWTVDDVREYIRAGYPVITLTKYRKLPGRLGSQTDFDHYVVITGLAGDDFIYNDAAFGTEYGRNLIISPAELESAWAASSIPRHGMAVGLGDAVRPLPIVPRRLQPDVMAATARDPAVAARALEGVDGLEGVRAVPVEPPLGMVPGRATQNLRERLLDELGARSSIVGDGESLEALHPSDVLPDQAELANIRIPAEALPDEEGAPARLVVPGAVEEFVGAADETVAATAADTAETLAADALHVDATRTDALPADAVGPAAGDSTVDYDDWSRRGAQITGLTGLILFIAGWIGRRRRLAEERRFPAQRAARAPAPVEL